MFKVISSLGLVLFITVSCQSHSPSAHYEKAITRSLASTPAFRIFLEELASKSGRYSTVTIEKEALAYIRKVDPKKKYGNWNELGITEEQAKSIKTLNDELPFMPKVRKWITENATKFLRIEVKVAEAAYDAMKRGLRVVENPYRFSETLTDQVLTARNRFKPRSLLSQQERIMVRVKDIPTEFQPRIKNNMKIYMQRAGQNPSIIHNGEEIVESGVTITRKTGKPGIGKGCESFSETASAEVIAEKANIDVFSAQQVEEMAYVKNGRAFKTFEEVPVRNRLTEQEIDEARVQAFKKIKGFTDDEAEIAVRRLKSEPCQIY